MAADHEAVEQVSEILTRVCAAGVAVEAPFLPVADGLAARIDVTRPAIVRGYLPARDPRAVASAIEAVRAALGHLQAFAVRPIGELETRLVNEEDWAEAWKAHFPVLHVGRRVVIRPTWREYRSAPGEVVIGLDPGMAFGTGLHPTTRLCLSALEELAERGRVRDALVLDVGSGSGILSLAAGLLGARRVLAVDSDPLAVEATAKNAEINALGGVVDVRRGSLPLAEPALFDVVLANLIAGLLVDLAPQLAAALAPGGRLLASGIFHEREAEVGDAFSAVGLQVVGRLVEEDWIALDCAPATGRGG